MPTRYIPSALRGDEGVDFISITCSRSNALFIPRPRQDIGIDGYIEFLNAGGDTSGAIAFVQVKAGLSHITKSGRYLIRADKAHFETWSRYSVPVIGIVYNPAVRHARWVSISEHIRSNRSVLENGPFTIEAPASQVFSEAEFSKFSAYVNGQHRSSAQVNAQEMIERYLLGDATTKQESLAVLFSQYRWTALTCFFVHQMLRTEKDPSLVEYLAYLISFYRPHWDRLYRDENDRPERLDPALRRLAFDCLAGFDRVDVVKMISVIDDENGLDRGGIGPIIATQLESIPQVEVMLREIAGDRRVEGRIRGYAIQILIVYFEFRDESFLLSLLTDEDDSFLSDVVEWGLEGLATIRREEHLPSNIVNMSQRTPRPSRRRPAAKSDYVQPLLF